ncbi:head-tail connector protein [Carnobacterium divergens]|uniref:head-tail connector protein n=1 Tax=Carnobacterium divergens TaxID=2748 RepID=UPI0039C9793D
MIETSEIVQLLEIENDYDFEMIDLMASAAEETLKGSVGSGTALYFENSQLYKLAVLFLTNYYYRTRSATTEKQVTEIPFGFQQFILQLKGIDFAKVEQDYTIFYPIVSIDSAMLMLRLDSVNEPYLELLVQSSIEYIVNAVGIAETGFYEKSSNFKLGVILLTDHFYKLRMFGSTKSVFEIPNGVNSIILKLKGDYLCR